MKNYIATWVFGLVAGFALAACTDKMVQKIKEKAKKKSEEESAQKTENDEECVFVAPRHKEVPKSDEEKQTEPVKNWYKEQVEASKKEVNLEDDSPKKYQRDPSQEVIFPEQVGEDGYDVVTLTYFSDGELSEEDGTILNDPEVEDAVGWDFAEYFGKYEDDSVHIRNHKRKIDYEILKDERTYTEFELTIQPHKRGKAKSE